MHRRLRPTRALGILGLILLAMGLAASNYQSNGAWLVIFITIALIGVSAVWAWRNLGGLVLTLGESPVVPAHSPSRVPAILGGTRDHWGVTLGLADQPPGDPVPGHLDLPPYSRGIHRPDAVRVGSSWPFGLFRVEVLLPVDLAVIVHPQPRGQGWESRDNRATSGDPVEFAGTRPWQTGDRPRHIDWRAATRREDLPPPVKTFASGGDAVRWLNLEQTQGDDLEWRLGQLARWVIDLHQLDLCWGLRLPGVEIPPGKGLGQQRACLAALAAWRAP